MIKKVLNYMFYITISIIIIVAVYIAIQKNFSKESYTNIFGYTFFEVLTGSMSGTLEIGDGVIVKLTREVEQEDIIVYEKDKSLITHRIVERQGEKIVTKGDANNIQDEPITKADVVGKVIFVIPNINFWKKVICAILIVLICIVIVIQQIKSRGS